MMAAMTQTEPRARHSRLPAALIVLGAASAIALIAAHAAGFTPSFPLSLIWTAPAIVFALGAAMLYARTAAPAPSGPAA